METLTQQHIDNFNNNGELTSVVAYQMVSRKNDVNGNPYRLIMAYLSNGQRVGYQERSSRPNIRRNFNNLDAIEMIEILVTTTEYTRLKRCCSHIFNL